MRWDLSDVGLPNCVPEYFREQFEREEHEAQLYWERMEHYNTNKRKMEKAYEAGLPVYSMEVMMTANPAKMRTTIHRPVTMTISVQ